MLPNEIRDFARKPSTVVNGTRGHYFRRYHTVRNQDTVIIVTKCGGLVNDACAVRIGDIGVDENSKSLSLVLLNE